jgi:DNA polymerase-3 subunit epsilon
MTGLDPAIDAVVEVCAERWVGDELVDSFLSLVKPPVAQRAHHVHGISDEMVEHAPTVAACAERIAEVVEGGIVIAHAAEWDAKFLAAEDARMGRPWNLPNWLDTLVLSRRAFALPSHSMDALCTHFAIERGQAHRAGDDVRALRAVWSHCIASLSPGSLRDLWDVRIAERKARDSIVAACALAVDHGLPVELTYRPSRKPAQVLTMILQQVRTDLDPPRVMGYQLPSRGRKELRADRILRVGSVTPSETS